MILNVEKVSKLVPSQIITQRSINFTRILLEILVKKKDF